MAFNSRVLEEGDRNLVILLTGVTPDSGEKLIIPADLNPPCIDVRLDKVGYDIGTGGKVKLAWGDDSNILVQLSEGNGQTLCFKKYGGINKANDTVSPNIILSTESTGDPATYTLFLHFVKKNSLRSLPI